jgi:uncharacterized protein YyaL (SSP411 family)
MINLFFLIRRSLDDSVKNFLFPYLPFPLSSNEDSVCLERVIDWIEQSVIHGKGGSSSHYDLLRGDWTEPFPETTGYLIPTLYDYAHFSGNNRYIELATGLADWLIKVQLPNGGCIQGNYNPKDNKQAAIIFNTGQNIFGFARAYKETGKLGYLERAKRAGDLIINSVDENKIWNKNLHRGLKHTINSRTSWALLELYQIIPNPQYREVAIENLNWTIEQQTSNGWFRNGASRMHGLPNTHFLSYTCEGLIQSYNYLKDPKYLKAATLTTDKMFRIFESRKVLYTFWDDKWKNHGKYLRGSKGKFICLTGSIQISMVWMWLFEMTNDVRYLNAAFKMLDFVKTAQNINTDNTGIKGGIPGSFPIYGSYSTLKYPNWAAKFFADALMMKIDFTRKINENNCSLTLPFD